MTIFRTGDSGLRDWMARNGAFAFLVMALVAGTAARLRVGLDLPLWIDESFTATIATQPDVSHLVRWCLTELTGPAFYMPMWAWIQLVGSSDAMLRLPPLLMALATPLLVARYGHPDRPVALLWAALCFLWLPALTGSTEARAYPQLLLLGCGQAVAFMAVVRNLRSAPLFAWSALTALMVLTHYYALVVAGLQGLALLILFRRRLVGHWAAFLPLVVAGGWMAIHLAYLMQFAATRFAAYNPLHWTYFFLSPMLVFGVGLQGYVVAAALCWTIGKYRDKAPPPLRPERLLGLIGLAGVTALLLVGFWKASFAPRYLTPVMPALLFGLAYWARRYAAIQPIAVIVTLWSLLMVMATQALAGNTDVRMEERRAMTIEPASAWLAQEHPERVYFLWSTPTGEGSSARNLADVAGFHFRRAGVPVDVKVVRTGLDPNMAMIKAARGDPGSALLWFSDNPLSERHRPRIGRTDATWQCRDFGGVLETVYVYACRRPRVGTS